MSCSSRCRFKFVKLSAVISFLLTSQLYAATIGTTHVKSAQHEPLSATIDVTDIQADNFSVALANQQIYQQMGLTAKPTMSVKFVKSSPNSGKVVITTAAPLTEPFADVVLTVNDAGKQLVVPKTLLLPLEDVAMPTKSKTPTTTRIETTGSTQLPNLPVVSPTAPLQIGQPILGQPLPIKNSLPPPIRILSVTPQMPKDEQLNAASAQDTDATAIADNDNASTGIDTNRTYRPSDTDTSDNLTADMGMQQSSQENEDDTALQTAQVANDNITKAKADTKSNSDNTRTPATAQAKTSAPKQATQKTASIPTPDIALGPHTYTVQKNDNLWTIANQIAKENNLSIQKVMQQIRAYNQDAFIEGDISLLKADSKLKLPDYKVIPSKLGIKAAIEARKAQQQARNSSTTASANTTNSTQNKQSSKATTANNTQANRTAKTLTQPLPRPHVTLVTPSKSGSATGSQTTQTATGTGLNGELLSKLQSTRQLTASRVQRVQSLNQQLAESTNRMHLQNQRLADLEQRLKNLRNK